MASEKKVNFENAEHSHEHTHTHDHKHDSNETKSWYAKGTSIPYTCLAATVVGLVAGTWYLTVRYGSNSN